MEEIVQNGAKQTKIPRKGGVRKLVLTWALCAASASCLTSVAGTVYVDNGLQSYTGHDGTSWATAFKTIQEGVNAAADGDTVLVASGVYGDEQGKVAAASGYHACRVYIDKAITLKSLDGRFHDIIYDHCGSQVLRDTLEPLHNKVQKYRMASLSQQDRAALSVAEHEAIYQAIVNRDADLADRLMTEHVKNALENIIRKGTEIWD